MVRLASDAAFDGIVYTGLFLRQPDLDLVRVQDVGLRTADDPTILDWAAREDRVLLTPDRRTMPRHARHRISAGLSMPGLIVIRKKFSRVRIIDEILIVANCSVLDEWKNAIAFLPL